MRRIVWMVVVLSGGGDTRFKTGSAWGVTDDARVSNIFPERLMPPQKTLQQREEELQALLATPSGQQEPQQRESRYQAVSSPLRPARTSVITSILVHEREQGLLRS